MTSSNQRLLSPVVTDQLPTPVGPYSPGIIVGNLVFVSGQAGRDPHTGAMADDVESQTEQTLSIGAEADGQFTALHHGVVSETSVMEDWTEPSAIVSRMLYACDNQSTTHRLARMNIAVPPFTRAPGEASVSFVPMATIIFPPRL